MPPLCPVPQRLPYAVIHIRVRRLGVDRLVILRPALDDRIEQQYQVDGLRGVVVADDSSHLVQEVLNILLGRLDDQLALVLADILTQEIKSTLDMRDLCLLCCKTQTSI